MRWVEGELQVDDGDGVWKHYKHSSMFKPDYPTDCGSKGYATMQNCLKNGYTYQKTEQD